MHAQPQQSSWMGLIQTPATVPSEQKRKMRRGPAPARPRPSLPPSHALPYGLTPAEVEVLALLLDGASNSEIGRRRKCALGTVKVHLGRIYRKLGVDSRTQAVLLAERLVCVRESRFGRKGDTSFAFSDLRPQAVLEKRNAGEVLFRIDDRAECLYFIEEGCVAFPEVGRQAATGNLFGIVGVFAEARLRTASAICETSMRLLRLDAAKALDLYLLNPNFALHVTRTLIDHVRRPLEPGRTQA